MRKLQSLPLFDGHEQVRRLRVLRQLNLVKKTCRSTRSTWSPPTLRQMYFCVYCCATAIVVLFFALHHLIMVLTTGLFVASIILCRNLWISAKNNACNKLHHRFGGYYVTSLPWDKGIKRGGERGTGGGDLTHGLYGRPLLLLMQLMMLSKICCLLNIYQD